MRKNIAPGDCRRDVGVSQVTVSLRWDVLRPAIAQVLAEFVPDLDRS
jgi:hypothetical protein